MALNISTTLYPSLLSILFAVPSVSISIYLVHTTNEENSIAGRRGVKLLAACLPPSFPFCLEGPHPSNACLQRPPVLFFPIKSWNMCTVPPSKGEKRACLQQGKCFHFALGDRAKDQITPPVKEERFPTSYANTISFFRDLFIFVLGFSLGWIVNRRRRRDEE